ncbi:hypothetical protein [Pedobacter terrae]|uniref:hypothetical protein n=1 Tax=Pedobacter terrae TaxID=405671 RepID=UPI002FFB7C18
MKEGKGALILHSIFWATILIGAVVIVITTGSGITLKREFISFGVFGILNVSLFSNQLHFFDS